MNINESDFPKLLSKNISRIVIPDTHPIFYGSISNPDLIYKGDIDIITNLEIKERDFTMKQIKNLLKAISIIKDGSIYISDIKFGENEKIKNEIEELTKNKYIDKHKLISYLNHIKKPSPNLYKLINSKMNNENFYKLKDELRDYYVNRWTYSDILEGKADNILTQDSPVFKLDVETYNGFRYIQMSNFIIFKSNKAKQAKESKDQFIESLKDNIYKTLYSDNNIYKVLKRFYTYFRQIKKHKLQERIEDILNNPELGNLYIILTLFKVHKTLIEFNGDHLDVDKFRQSLDSLKMNTIYLNEDMREELNKIIDALNKKKPKEIISDLTSNIEKIQSILNKATNSILKEHKISVFKLINDL